MFVLHGYIYIYIYIHVYTCRGKCMSVCDAAAVLEEWHKRLFNMRYTETDGLH